jgi:hypothetical protein
MSHIQWVVRGTGTPKDKDDVVEVELLRRKRGQFPDETVRIKEFTLIDLSISLG